MYVCMVRYSQVRREIRTLTATDLANFVDVTHVLWNTSDLDGKQRYGSAYNSASYLLKLHHFNAGQLDAVRYCSN